MRLHLITVGEAKLKYAKEGWTEYYTRLSRYHQLKVTRIRDSDPVREGKQILESAKQAYLMPLDPKGVQLTSEALSGHLDRLAVSGRSDVAFVIGSSLGLSDEVRERAHFLWSLSYLTFPHDLAMVLMLEALYRASSISRGEPYHK